MQMPVAPMVPVQEFGEYSGLGWEWVQLGHGFAGLKPLAHGIGHPLARPADVLIAGEYQ